MKPNTIARAKYGNGPNCTKVTFPIPLWFSLVLGQNNIGNKNHIMFRRRRVDSVGGK